MYRYTIHNAILKPSCFDHAAKKPLKFRIAKTTNILGHLLNNQPKAYDYKIIVKIIAFFFLWL